MENSTDKNKDIKSLVKETYSRVVNQNKAENEKSLCGEGSCCQIDYTIFSEDYSNLKGYCKTADLGVGCGIPTKAISIKEGDTVLDLGCGAGNDCFIAREMVGEKGHVIGLDFTPEMLRKAWQNCDSMGYHNVEFRFGDIEDMPILNSMIDVILSNCVINLVPDKKKAFLEIARVLKQTGFFSISDVVTNKSFPSHVKEQINLYTGCVAGAMVLDEYLEIIKNCGFDVEIKKQKEVVIPEEIFAKFLTNEQLKNFLNLGIKVYSVTIVGRKIQKFSDNSQEKVECQKDSNKNCCK